MILDIVVLIIALIGFFSGYKKGLIYMVLFFVGIILGLLAALKLSGITSSYLEQWFNISASWLPLVSLVLTFLLAFLVIRFIAGLLVKFLKLIQLNFINRIAGGVIGTLIGIAFCSIAVWYSGELNLIGNAVQNTSVTYEHLKTLGPEIISTYEKVLPVMKGLYEELSTILQEFSTPSKSAEMGNQFTIKPLSLAT